MDDNPEAETDHHLLKLLIELMHKYKPGCGLSLHGFCYLDLSPLHVAANQNNADGTRCCVVVCGVFVVLLKLSWLSCNLVSLIAVSVICVLFLLIVSFQSLQSSVVLVALCNFVSLAVACSICACFCCLCRYAQATLRFHTSFVCRC